MSSLIDQKKIQENLDKEREYHNNLYRNAMPFDFQSLYFNKDDVWNFLDSPWKEGRFITGRRNRRFIELMDLNNITGKKILDVGCGNGQFCVFFAMYGAEVWGIEISEIGIEVAKKTAEINNVSDRCHFVVGDATSTNLSSNQFDYITFSAVLHHIVKYPGIREETWRLLKPSGKLVFCDILRENKIDNLCKSVYRYFYPETDSGINITMEDYDAFFSDYKMETIELYSLLEGWKHFLPRRMVMSAPGRTVLYASSKLDDAILRSFPSLSRYCLEIVGAVRKPIDAETRPTVPS